MAFILLRGPTDWHCAAAAEQRKNGEDFRQSFCAAEELQRASFAAGRPRDKIKGILAIFCIFRQKRNPFSPFWRV